MTDDETSILAHRSLQIRGLVELERKREEEGLLTNSITGSPIKQRLTPDNMMHNDGASVGSGGGGNDRPDSLERERERAREHLGHPAAAAAVGGHRFSLDDVRSRLHGQLEIQPVSQQPTSSLPPHWSSLDGRQQVRRRCTSVSSCKAINVI